MYIYIPNWKKREFIMMIDVKEVAKLLSVSEKTVYRWISKKEIPVYKIGDTYRFNRVELMEWTTANKINVSHKIFEENEDSSNTTTKLSDSLEQGGIYYHVNGNDKKTVLKSIVSLMNLPDDIDREFLLEALIARENLGTTAIGNGIAIPHVRDNIIFHIEKPIISLCFLEKPIDFESLDNKPVDAIFTIISTSVRTHLSILSRLTYALNTPYIRDIIKSSSNRQEIINIIAEFDTKISKNKAEK